MALFGRNGVTYAAAPAADDSTNNGPLEEVVVTGIRASLRDSITVKRESDAVVDAITAEDVGKFPDKNVAEALQRVPGVVVNRIYGEGERVSVRGAPNNLTHTTMNGHGMATADWFILDQQAATRSFNYLILPADLIGQVKVYKSQQADLEEGGIGGSVDVLTRKPLDLKSPTAVLGLEAVHTELAGHTTPDASALGSWKNDEGTLGVLVAGVYQHREIRRDGIEVLGYSPQAQVGGARVPDLIGAPLFLQNRVRKGGNFAVEWKPIDSLTMNLNGLYSRFGADNLNESYLAWGANALGNGGTLSNAVIQNGYAVAGTINSHTGTGEGAVNDDIIRSSFSKTRNLDLDTTFEPASDWLLHLDLGYSDALGATDPQAFYESQAPAAFNYDLRGIPTVNFLDVNPQNPLATKPDFWSYHQIDNTDYERYGFLDVTKRLDLGVLQSIKFGVKATSHARSLNFNATAYGDFYLNALNNGCNGGPCTNANFAALTSLPGDFLKGIGNPGSIRSFWQINQQAVLSVFSNALNNLSKLGRIPYPQAEFSVLEQTQAGYVMGEFKGGDQWSGNLGVRFVKTKQTSLGVTPAANGILSNAFGNYNPVDVRRTYNDVLPSLNFKYNLTQELLVRLGLSRAMTRPDYIDISPLTTLNIGAFSGAQGNPNLDPFRANQGEITLEWYPDENTAISGGIFYKKILSFITDKPVVEDVSVQIPVTSVRQGCSAIDVTRNQYSCPFTINVRSNGGGGSDKGFELDVTRPIWNGFGVQASYTYSDAHADNGDPLPDNSKHIYNFSGFFENSYGSARLSWTERSNFLVQFDRSTQLRQVALKSLDASFVYNVNAHLSLTADGVNLTNAKIEQYADTLAAPRAIYENGRVYFLGVRMKL
jgi:iron complex outermembrane recepter protein